MRSSTFLTAAATLLSLATASPLDSRQQTCTAPQQWYTCGYPEAAWTGCCSVDPCKGPQETGKSHCPDEPTPTPSSTPSTTTSTSSCTPSPTRDTNWLSFCKSDASDCNFSPRFFTIKSDNETFSSNRTDQFHAQKDEGVDAPRRDVIALFTNIPAHVENCTVQWYKPATGMFYGTFGDGALNISTLDTGDKSLLELADPVNLKTTKSLVEKETYRSVLDLGNWGRSAGSANLIGTKFACEAVKGELAVHFALNAEWEGSVIVDQVAVLGGTNNGFVQRAGWYLNYE